MIIWHDHIVARGHFNFERVISLNWLHKNCPNSSDNKFFTRILIRKIWKLRRNLLEVNKLIVCVAVTGMYLLGVNKLIVCVAVTGMYLLGVNKLMVCVAVTGMFVSPTR